jgi:DNA-binding NarL/FixJ family response regulator
MSTEKKLVFIVEDNPHQQKVLQVHFEEILGAYRVRQFISPDDLMAHLNEKPYAIVLDHFFEGQSKTGLDYLTELRKKHKKLAVIYHTTVEDEALKKKVLDLGAEAYIVKNSASMVYLRTALDQIAAKAGKRGFFRRLISK